MIWISLIIAGLLEVAWAYTMKQSDGFTRFLPSVITAILMLASFAFLSFSMKHLPIGTAYTMWTGIGAIGTFIVGIIFLGEELNLIRISAVILIFSGLILMKISAH